MLWEQWVQEWGGRTEVRALDQLPTASQPIPTEKDRDSQQNPNYWGGTLDSRNTARGSPAPAPAPPRVPFICCCCCKKGPKSQIKLFYAQPAAKTPLLESSAFPSLCARLFQLSEQKEIQIKSNERA